MLQAGLNLGIYSIDGLIARGSMGDVYRARDTRLNRVVALKLLSPLLANNPRHFARFDRDARTVAVLNHPNIASVYDVGSYDGRPFVVSELLQGMNLRARMAAGPMTAEDGVGYALQIACGLVAGHQVDVVHRDLRPENIFVTDGGRVKILDFGLGRSPLPIFEPPANRPSRGVPSRMVRGPIGYLSPEQAYGEPGDQRSDIFSAGVMLYEMLTGRLPSERPLTSAPEIPAGIERVIRNCVASNPENRYESARDLVFALELVDLAPRRGAGDSDSSRRSLPYNMMWLT